jgi:hypothetical protein
MKRSVSEMLEEGLKDFTVRIVGSFLIAGILFGLVVWLTEYVFGLDKWTALKIYEGIAGVVLFAVLIIYCFFLQL